MWRERGGWGPPSRVPSSLVALARALRRATGMLRFGDLIVASWSSLIWTHPVEQASHEMDTDEDCTLISGLWW